MAPSPITSWQIDGQTMETVTNFISWVPKSLQMVTQTRNSKMKKNYDKPRQHIKKQRYYVANKVHLVKAMVFPVVMHGCGSWTIKNAEHGRIDVFEL